MAGLLARSLDLRPFDFATDLFPPVGHPGALEFFFAATLQQFGFWSLESGRYGAPMWASLGGRRLKGSDYLWGAYLRWMSEAPHELSPEGQSTLDTVSFARRLSDDEGRSPLPEPDLYLEGARRSGQDMTALALTPRMLLATAAASAGPVQACSPPSTTWAGTRKTPCARRARSSR